MSASISPAEAARLLRQRLEMGGDALVLDGMTREEALAVLVKARAARSAHPVTQVGAPPRSVAEPPVAPERPARTKAGSATAPPPAPSAGAPRTQSGAEGWAASAGGVASTGVRELPVLPDEYDQLREIALGCTQCGLAHSRTQVVFSDGPPDARLMVVGEAPGANEDATGVPFVGAAGQFLDLLLATVGLSREDSVYIANVLKCRPPGNRDPQPGEIEACSPFLLKQIELVKPSALLAVGSFSGKLLTGQEKASLGSLRGKIHTYHGVPLVVTYHPAALLRNRRWTRAFWDDLQLLRSVIDAG